MATPQDSPITPWFSTNALTSDEMRYALGALVSGDGVAGIGSEIGVMPAVNAGLVTALSATSVSVAPFQAVAQHSTGATYVVTFPATVTVPVDANASNSRYDRLIVEVLDSEVIPGDGAKVARLRVVSGVAGASPVEPSIPTTAVELARLTVTSASIAVTDRRLYTRSRGGVRLATAYDNRNGSFPGDRRSFPDGKMDVWDGTQWITTTAPVAWTQENTSLTYAGGTYSNGTTAPSGTVGLGEGSSAIVRYKRTGNDLTVSYAFRWGAQPWNGGVGNIYTRLPQNWVTTTSRDQWIPCQLWVRDTYLSQVLLDFAGMALIQSGSNIVRPYFPRSNGTGGFATGLQPYRVNDGSGPGSSIPYIANGYAIGGTLHIGPIGIELAG